MCFVWDGNHNLQALISYIEQIHIWEESWHYAMDSIMLDTKDGIMDILKTTTNLNKQKSSLSMQNYRIIIVECSINLKSLK
jgi:hypothetical protein